MDNSRMDNMDISLPEIVNECISSSSSSLSSFPNLSLFQQILSNTSEINNILDETLLKFDSTQIPEPIIPEPIIPEPIIPEQSVISSHSNVNEIINVDTELNNVDSNNNANKNIFIMDTNLSDLELNNFGRLEKFTTNKIIDEYTVPVDKIEEIIINTNTNTNTINKLLNDKHFDLYIKNNTTLEPVNNIIRKNIHIPEVEIMDSMEKSIEKNQVKFSSSDLYEIKSFNDNSNNFGNSSSIATNSEFSYTNAIKTKKMPYIEPLIINKNLRITKLKEKKKIVELDEVDYLYNKLQDYRRNMIVDRTNYVLIIIKAMEIIENYIELEGIKKKDIVIKAINRLIMIDLDLNDLDQRLFLSSMSNVIELVISSTNTKPVNNDKKNFNNKNNHIDDIVLASCGQIIYSIIDKITTIVLKKQYTADKIFTNIATITEILMILADKYSYLTGSEKKMIVLQSIDKFIKTKLEYVIELPKTKKDDLINALDSVPMIIDLFITVQKGKYKINKKQTMIVSKQCWYKSLCGSKSKYND